MRSILQYLRKSLPAQVVDDTLRGELERSLEFDFTGDACRPVEPAARVRYSGPAYQVRTPNGLLGLPYATREMAERVAASCGGIITLVNV